MLCITCYCFDLKQEFVAMNELFRIFKLIMSPECKSCNAGLRLVH